MCSRAVGAALPNKHDLIDAGLLVTRQMGAQLVGGADAAAPGIVRQLVLDLQKAFPKIGSSGPVLTEERVITQRVPEEAEPVDPAMNCFALVRVTQLRGAKLNSTRLLAGQAEPSHTLLNSGV